MSYIEREKVLAEYDRQHKGPPGGARKIIETFPAADVRPVVLCRDCKHNKGKKIWADGDETFDCTNGHGYPPLDWFCADGERR